jgi:hypothetical protein
MIFAESLDLRAFREEPEGFGSKEAPSQRQLRVRFLQPSCALQDSFHVALCIGSSRPGKPTGEFAQSLNGILPANASTLAERNLSQGQIAHHAAAQTTQ